MIEVGDGFVVFVLFQPSGGAVKIDLIVFGIETDGLCEVGDRFIVLLFRGPGHAACVINLDHLGIEPDRFCVIGDSGIVLRQIGPSNSPIIESSRRSSVDLDGRVRVVDGLSILTLEVPNTGAADVRSQAGCAAG